MPDQPPSEMTRGRRAVWTVVAAAVVAAITLSVGTNGFYFFDTSIPLFSGWLVWGGWTPFRDYQTPLMPLNAVLVALSYALFGVRYLSTVIVAASCAVAAFLVALRAARQVVAFPEALLAVLVGTLFTLPAIGTLFYNHLLSALLLVYAMLGLALIARPAGAPATALRLGIGVVLALATLTKLHFGVFVALQCGVELLLGRNDLRRLPVNLLLAAGPTLLGCAAVVAWAGFDPALVVRSIAIPQAGTQIQTTVQNLFVFAGLPLWSGDPPALSRLFFLLLLGTAAVAWRAQGAPPRRLLPLAFAAAVILCEQLVTLPSTEAQATHAFVYPVAIVALLQAAPTQTRPALSLLVMPLLLALLVYATSYDLRWLRKAWSDPLFQVVRLAPPEGRSAVPYFAGVRLQPEHVAVIDGVAAVRAAHPHARILFGPGLEALFPAFGQLPPHGWLNWFHYGVSYRAEAAPAVRAAFVAGRYDMVLLADHRDPMLLPVMRGRYRACGRFGGWATLYCAEPPSDQPRAGLPNGP